MNGVCALWKYIEWWASIRSNGSQKKFFETLYTFKFTLEQSMPSVKVHWVVGFKLKQWVSEEVFQNIIHIQAHNWTKYALCESTLSGGLQVKAMAFKRSFAKHYKHSNIHLNKVCLLRKFSEWWASSRRNGYQKRFFKTLYILKHTIEQCMRSVKVHWVVGFKQKQWLAEEFFETLYTFKHTLEQSMPSVKVHWVVVFRQKQWVSEEFFETIYTFKHILNNVCPLWKYSALCASSRSNGIQKKFFKTLYIFKRTIEQSMRSVKVHWAVGLKQKQWLSEEVFWNIIRIQTNNWTKYALRESTLVGWLQAEAMARRRSFSKQYTHSSIHLNKVCLLWKYTEWWASIRSNGSQKKFFKTLYTFKHTLEQSMPSAKF